ncbi:MAG: 4-hydroxyproline epimerase [Enterobacteriaceae bacterium]
MDFSEPHRIHIIDSHTGGEPTRMVVSGFPLLPQTSLAEQRDYMHNHLDQWRQALILEPHGHEGIVGALLCPPQKAEACCGVIFFNNSGYLGMCGHGTIGVIRSLAYLGRITPGEHLLQTPVGDIVTQLHDDGSVTVRNVPAYRYRRQVAVEVPGYGQVCGDIAWGGNWFFLVEDHAITLNLREVERLTDYCWTIRQALEQAGITGKEGAVIDHIELCCADKAADSRNFVLCPGQAYDRSPCGTGTSARLACLAADGRLAPGVIWRQASITGSEFQAWYSDGEEGITPFIRGRAHLCSDSQLLIEPQDPFAWGIC